VGWSAYLARSTQGTDHHPKKQEKSPVTWKSPLPRLFLRCLSEKLFKSAELRISEMRFLSVGIDTILIGKSVLESVQYLNVLTFLYLFKSINELISVKGIKSYMGFRRQHGCQWPLDSYQCGAIIFFSGIVACCYGLQVRGLMAVRLLRPWSTPRPPSRRQIGSSLRWKFFILCMRT